MAGQQVPHSFAPGLAPALLCRAVGRCWAQSRARSQLYVKVGLVAVTEIQGEPYEPMFSPPRQPHRKENLSNSQMRMLCTAC